MSLGGSLFSPPWGRFLLGLFWPLTFPMGSYFLLFGALWPLITQAERLGRQADGSPEHAVPLHQCYSSLGDPSCQETYFCPANTI